MADEDDADAGMPEDSWQRFLAHPGGGPAWGEMIAGLRTFLDTLAAASPAESEIAALRDGLAGWTARLAPTIAPELEQIFGRREDLPWRGRAWCRRSRSSPAMHRRSPRG